ncbi:ATP-binding cassette domain-containing protein, partial [Staphylococcus hominis]
FEQLNMQFADNQLTVLLGENGAGKSTLLRLISGIEQPNSGTIDYFGKTLSKRQIRNIVGYVPQDIALFEHMSAQENIQFFKSLCDKPVDDDTIAHYLKLLN